MRIGALARQTGVSHRLLRYYEEQGLLRPTRLPSGYREYTEADARTVRRSRGLRSAGLNTAMIATLLPCLRPEADALVPTCPELLATRHGERARLTGAIDEPHASRAALDTVIAAATSSAG